MKFNLTASIFSISAALAVMTPICAQASALTQSQAVGYATTFCKAVGVTIPTNVVSSAVITSPDLSNLSATRTYYLPIWHIVFANFAEVDVADADHSIVRYLNLSLINLRETSTTSSNLAVVLSTSALTNSQSCFASSGIASNVASPTIQLNTYGASNTYLQNYEVIWSRQDAGLLYEQQQVICIVDAVSGIVMAMNAHFTTSAISSTLSMISQSSAQSIASAYVTSTFGASQTVSLVSSSQTVAPSTVYSSNPSYLNDFNAHLCWNFNFSLGGGSSVIVYIDALNGNILGISNRAIIGHDQINRLH